MKADEPITPEEIAMLEKMLGDDMPDEITMTKAVLARLLATTRWRSQEDVSGSSMTFRGELVSEAMKAILVNDAARLISRKTSGEFASIVVNLADSIIAKMNEGEGGAPAPGIATAGLLAKADAIDRREGGKP